MAQAADFIDLVADIEDRGVCLQHAVDEREQPFTVGEARGGLIEQQHVGSVPDSPDDLNPLAHTEREILDEGRGRNVGYAVILQDSLRLPLDPPLRDEAKSVDGRPRQKHVCRNRERRNEAELLKGRGHTASARIDDTARLERRPGHTDLPGIRHDDPAQDLDQS